ncbi:prolipoprotein diacylglyceryl transferase [bacterium]|nr:prolipoprotein diacylglyceryl transferase [bacterium]
MRQVLFRIPWEGISLGGVTLPLFGFGLLFWVLLAVLTGGVWLGLRSAGPASSKNSAPAATDSPFDIGSMLFWLFALILVVQARVIGPRMAPEGLPIFGYGVMLLIGLTTAVFAADWRARSEGLPPETIWDLAIWLFIPGIIGARIFYLVQYRDRVFTGVENLPQFVWATVNLSEGGIVLYGGLLAGAAAYFTFCAVKKLPPLQLADIITPSVFIGIGFGRIGCLLNGCCYGDACTLPWGLEFPAQSVPFLALVERGFLAPDALHTPPLHPTQIYAALDGFFIAALTWWYYGVRRVPGDVLGLALLISPLTRFLIEILRGDEYGQWGTTLTISQWVSVALFTTGLLFQIYLSRQAHGVRGGLPSNLKPSVT